MAFDRKTSKYPNYGASGSSEELEAYGVWVKSEPQDVAESFDDVSGFPGASSFAGVSDFAGISSFPDASDFSTGFDDIGMPRADFSDLESNDFGLGDFGFDNFDDGLTGEPGDVSPGGTSIEDASFEKSSLEDASLGDVTFENFTSGTANIKQEARDGMSTQLLMKIADELSSIRTELSGLKNEFTGSRAETGAGGIVDSSPGGFFSGDDEKIALTGDEMEDILSSADLSSEESLPFDPLREEDEAALKRLSEQNESLVPVELTPPPEEALSSLEDISSVEDAASLEGIVAPEEIDIDFDDLGIILEPEKAGHSAEQSIDEDLDAISLDDEVPLDDDDGLQDLQPEEAAPAEDDPFALTDTGLAPQPGPQGVEPELSVSPLADTDLNLDDMTLEIDDLSFDDAQTTDGSSLLSEASTLDLDDPLILDETLALDAPSSKDELSLEDATVLEETSSLDDALSLEDTSALDETLSLDDALSLEDTSALDETLSLDDALSLDDISSLDDMLSLEPPSGSETEETALFEEEMDSKEVSGFPEPSDSLEPGGKEPVLDDMTLDMDDLADDLATDDLTMDALTTDDSGTSEDSLPKVIPEAFEKGAATGASNPFDDDLEAFSDDEIALDDDEPLDDADKEGPLVKAEKGNGEENGLSDEMKEDVKKVLLYTDHLLESLPEEKIEEFAKSEHFDTYKKLFKELGLV